LPTHGARHSPRGESARPAANFGGHLAEAGGKWSEGRLSGARQEADQMFAGANTRGMQGDAVGR
jgi:hypothetical protein